MKQLLFLLLFPCLAMAQYQGNAGQKLTLGEQTTADGLVYRGVAADTTLTVKSDTAAYFVLDTVNLNLYTYKASASGRKWRQLGADTAAIAYVNTYGTQTVNGAKTFTSELTATRFNPTANTATGTGMFLPAANTLGLSTFGTEKVRITSGGNLLVGTTTDNGQRLQVNGTGGIRVNEDGSETTVISIRSDFAGVGPAVNVVTNNPMLLMTNNTEQMRITSDGEVWIGYNLDGARGTFPLQVNGQIFATNATIATSDEKFKENITPLNKGLEIVNKLKPVTFNFISDTKNNFSEYEEVGFIAQDVDRALSTETFAKSIVKAADDSEPTSTMGLVTSNLIPILVKAIQEQQTLIKALQQRILILENK